MLFFVWQRRILRHNADDGQGNARAIGAPSAAVDKTEKSPFPRYKTAGERKPEGSPAAANYSPLFENFTFNETKKKARYFGEARA